MTLDDILTRYLSTNTRIRSPRTAEHYERSVRLFGEFLGRVPLDSDLTDDNCSGYMLAIVRAGWTEATANQRIKQLRALANWAAKRRLIEHFPTFANLTEPERLPNAYRDDDLRKLFATCKTLAGWIGPLPESLWWLSQHWWYFDTGERPEATRHLRWEHLDIINRVARVPATIRKGRQKSMVYRLSQRTCDLVTELKKYPSPDGRVWWSPFGYQAYNLRYKKLVRLAGIPQERYKSGAYRMRVTVFTWIEAHGGNATAFARHSSRRVTEAYIDHALVLAMQRGSWPRSDFNPEQPKRKWFGLLGCS
jgi:integrase